MSILLLPKSTFLLKCTQSNPCNTISQCVAPWPLYAARNVHAPSTAAPEGVALSDGNRPKPVQGRGKRQPRRHDRDKQKQADARGLDPLQQRQQAMGRPGSLQAHDEEAFLAAVASCRSELELSNLYAFLREEHQAHTRPPAHNSPITATQAPALHHLPTAPAFLSAPLQAPNPPKFPAPHSRAAAAPPNIPPRQAVQLLTRLSQLSPAPALLAVPHLDTTAAYAPLPRTSSSSSSSSEPAGYVAPLHTQPPQQQQQQQGTDAATSRAAEVLEEEQAEDAASLEAMQKRVQQQQLVDSLLADAMLGLQQLPLNSVTGLLSALARLGYHSSSAGTDAVAQVAAHLQRSNALLLMHRRDPRALAHTGWALAKLGHDPGLHWIHQFLLATSASLPKLTAVDLSATAWALARWHFRPAPQWMGAFYTRLRQVAAQLGAQGICNVAWALAVLRVSPPREVAEVLMVEAQVQLPFFQATPLTTLCWSLAALGHKPPNFWLQEVFEALSRMLPKVPLAARGLPHANTAWALSVWQASPPPTFLAQLCTAATPHLPRMSAASCAVLLTGLADLGHRPQQAWVSLALEEFHKRHADASPASLVAMVWAVSRLLQPAGANASPPPGWTPPRKWRVRYAHVLQDIAWAQARVLHALEPAQLVDAAVAFADLSFYPGDEWMDRHEAYCNVRVEAFTAYQVRLLNSSMEKLDAVFEGDYLPRDGEVV